MMLDSHLQNRTAGQSLSILRNICSMHKYDLSVTVFLGKVISEIHLLPLQMELYNGQLLSVAWPWAFSIFFSPLPAITPSCSAFPARFPMWHLSFSFLKLLFHRHSLQMDVKSLSSPRGTLGRGLPSAVTALSPFPHAFVPGYSWCVCQALLWIGSEGDEGFYLWDGNCGAATDMDAALS